MFLKSENELEFVVEHLTQSIQLEATRESLGVCITEKPFISIVFNKK